jgi:hypothetical protein
MKPVPKPDTVAAMLTAKAPYQASGWHPWTWTARATGREAIKLN